MADQSSREDRRSFIRRVGVGAGIAWTAPVLATVGVPAAASSGFGPGSSPATFQLAWNDGNNDLDIHACGPNPFGGANPYHRAWFNRFGGPAHISLDDDSFDSSSPTETITISPVAGSFVAGTYRIWIHQYPGSSFAGSAAVVTTTAPDGTVCTHPLTTVTGTANTIWQVVTITLATDGTMTLTEQQAYTSGSSGTSFCPGGFLSVSSQFEPPPKGEGLKRTT